SAAAPAARCRKFRRGSFILNLPLSVLFDHLVSAQQHRSRDFEAKRLGGLEIELVGSMIGKSADFSPFRIRPA
ncbi:MAG TPA: hypothetical protein VM822_24610, partial [Pseudolabrys sp.]|nr:hypothetical protein [Pseudolabrys sp.]